MAKNIIMLIGGDHSSFAIYNALKNDYNISKVIIDRHSNKKAFLKRRIKRLGWFRVLGQVIFQVLVPRYWKAMSKNRIEDISQKYSLNYKSIEEDKMIEVNSVNSDECLHTLQQLSADIIIVNGTKIISKKILNGVDSVFINTHTGITPRYRGVHGGYWALANNDPEHCGVSVHLVDPGIDTGGILYQGVIHPTKKDNFVTYTYLQLGVGIALMKKALNDAHNDSLNTITNGLDSKLWYHPTIWFYLKTLIVKGVK
ncbi:hypothetical protein J8281_07440 [Aquimarina sp. U1-2]|uniref:formyl transferase n=1 Tax=Aquimarina sp. U1-2 TaxID=2823141 RepID=UPI001AECE066|nr:formyl transferase [Aquimarina sp. U1-2]MBP2832021.1 hypothetical protein [Aquimarina sp. U1-2]